MQAISLIIAWLQWTWPDLFDGWTKLLEFEFEWRELNVGNNVKYVTCSKNRIQYLSIKYVFFWALTESWTFPCNQSEINSNLLYGPAVLERNSVKVDGAEIRKWTTQEAKLNRSLNPFYRSGYFKNTFSFRFLYRSLLDSRTVYIRRTFAIMHMNRSI